MRNRGIRRQTLGYFITFTSLIVAVLWILEILFFNTFYIKMKQSAIQNISENLVAQYGSVNYQNTINEIAFRNNLSVIVFEYNDGLSSIQFSAGKLPQDGLSPQVLLTFITNLGNSSNISYVSGDNIGMQSLTYGAVRNINGIDYYFYVNTSLLPVDSTISVLITQLEIITAIGVLLSIIISLYFSKRISRPIELLTKSAKNLSTGNFKIQLSSDDFDEIKTLADNLNFAAEQIKKTDQLQKDLVANVSHELRTPLTIIGVYGELLRDVSGNNPQKRQEHINIILSETERLKSLVTDILDLSKIQADIIQFKHETFNLSACVTHIYHVFEELYKDKGFQFVNLIDDNLCILADKNRIEQVIFNLVSNAVNYSGERKHITIVLKLDNDKVHFHCIDQGFGIAEEDIPYIFDRFYTQRKEIHSSGSGIGLSLVKSILTIHHFDFGVHSKINEGSDFYFIAPYQKF